MKKLIALAILAVLVTSCASKRNHGLYSNKKITHKSNMTCKNLKF